MELIKRNENKTSKQSFNSISVNNQVSLNNWDHLVIRKLNPSMIIDGVIPEERAEDVLIVFDGDETRAIISFIERMRPDKSSLHFQNMNITVQDEDSLPF